jgi:hypothetical protein
MSLPFVSVPMAALSGTRGPRALALLGEKVYTFDRTSGATHLAIVDFSGSSPVVGSTVTLAKALGGQPLSDGSGDGWCLDGNGLVWTTYTTGGNNYITGMSPTTGAQSVTYEIGNTLTEAYAMGAVAGSTNYVLALTNNGFNPPTWTLLVVNAATGSLYWSFNLPVPAGFSNYSTLQVVDHFSTDGTSIYVMVYHESVSDVTVDKWAVFKLDITAQTYQEFDFDQSNATIGGGYEFLLNPVNSNLIFITSGGALTVADGTSGGVLNTYTGVAATLAETLSGSYLTSSPYQLFAFQNGLVDNVNSQFLVPAPTTTELQRVTLSTFAAVDSGNIPPDDWIGAGFTTESAVYAPFSPPAMMWTTSHYPTAGNFALLELEWSPAGPAWRRVLTGGGFVDSSGKPVAFGNLTMKLSADATSPGGQVCSGLKVSIPLDANGNIAGTPTVFVNSALNPSDTEYRAEVYSAAGQLCYGPVEVTVPAGTGPFNVANWVPGMWQ